MIEFGLLIAMLSLTTVTGASALSSGLAATFADVGATVSGTSPVAGLLPQVAAATPFAANPPPAGPTSAR